MKRLAGAAWALLLALIGGWPVVGHADTVASLLGNFTINQYCGLKFTDTNAGRRAELHYVVIFGQLPALRELHLADADGNGVTSQAERDAYVKKLAPEFADGLRLRIGGETVPFHAMRWTSSLPTEQGGFSLRVDVDFAAVLPSGAAGAPQAVDFDNTNYAGRLGWHEIVVEPSSGLAIFDTNAYSTSLTGGLTEALQSLPTNGPLDERRVHLSVTSGATPPHVQPLGPRAQSAVVHPIIALPESDWIVQHTRELVNAISSPRLEPRVIILALLGALLLGAVHALSPGHGKTIVGAYLIGSRGTPRHAMFLGLTVTITHTLGVFALGFATLYASRFIVPERLFPILSLISAVLVLGMGLVLLVQRGRAARAALAAMVSRSPVFYQVPPAAAASGARGLIFSPRTLTADPTMHSHGGGSLHSHAPPEKITWRSLLTLGISGGLVPCPSAMVLLLAAVALNKTGYGMLLVVAFSVGLAITLTLVGLAFLYARNRFRRPSAGARWPHLLPVMSACTITVVGVALCFGALKSFGS